MDSKSNKPSLKKLYKNEQTRNLIWDLLSEDFDDAYERLYKELKELRSPLVVQVKSNREFIKEMFIEYGYKLENLSDLKKIIDEIPISWDETDINGLESFSDCKK